MKTILLVFLIFSIVACDGDSATGVTETGNSIGAALTSVFSGEEEGALLHGQSLLLARLADFLMRKAKAQEEGGETACDNLDAPSDDVVTTVSVEPGTYGAPSNPITVTASDDCEDGGEFAGFSVTSHSLDCTNSGGDTMTLVMVNSSGIWRENLETNNTEIYGTFNIQLGDETATNIRCSLQIEHDGEGNTGTFSGICEDESGNAVEQSTDLTCTDTE